MGIPNLTFQRPAIKPSQIASIEQEEHTCIYLYGRHFKHTEHDCRVYYKQLADISVTTLQDGWNFEYYYSEHSHVQVMIGIICQGVAILFPVSKDMNRDRY